MNSVKARENYEAALSLLPELKEEQSVPQLFKVVRHVFSMNSLLRLMGDKDSVSIWKQRIDDLHAQLASSVVKFLQQFSPYVGAEACERLEQEKETLLSQLLLEKEKYTELHKRFQSQLKDTALKENLELRTRLVVQQQNMIQREAETRQEQKGILTWADNIQHFANACCSKLCNDPDSREEPAIPGRWLPIVKITLLQDIRHTNYEKHPSGSRMQ